jgi:hypothetical protein
MRCTWCLLLLAVLLLVPVRPLLAADQPALTPEEIRAKCAEIDAKCAAAAKAIDELQALKAELLRQLGLPAPTPPPAPKPSWTDKLSLSGYFQARYETFSRDEFSKTTAGADEDRFGIRRLFVNLMAKSSPRASAVVTWACTGSDTKQTRVDLTNVYAEYKLGQRDTVRFGQGPTWFGIELWQPSSARLPLERAAFLEGGSRGKPGGMFAGGRWDRGLWLTHTPQDNAVWPQATLSVVNGSFRNDPVNNDHALEVDLKWKPRWGICGVSWLNSEFQQPLDPETGKGAFVSAWGVGPFQRAAWLGYVRYEQPRSWALQSEYLGGVANMHTVRGWYGQLEKPFRTVPGTAFVKYEWYDPSTDTASDSDVYKAWILGYAHQLDSNNRLTAQGTWGRMDAKHLNETGLQWQCSY